MKTIQVSGTTVFHVAAQEYQDATQWWRIMRANPILIDTIIGPVTKLIIPNPDKSTSGDGIPFY